MNSSDGLNQQCVASWCHFPFFPSLSHLPQFQLISFLTFFLICLYPSSNESESGSVMSTLCNPMDYTVREFSRPEYQSGQPFPSPEDLPNPRIKLRSPALQAKPKNAGVSRLSLLQQIFLTQESNRSRLHCRWILYQLGYQGSLILTQKPYITFT